MRQFSIVSIIDAAHIPLAGFTFLNFFDLNMVVHSLGNFDPFVGENRSQVIDSSSSNESAPSNNLPSLDSIHDHVHHSLDTNETHANSNDTRSQKAGPSLDLIDSHAHSHDDDNTSAVETVKRVLMQPSIDFLDAQLHGGDEHAHNDRNQTDTEAADLNDFQRWLTEQNQTDQLKRFLLLQKEVNRFDLDDTQGLNDKLNRTIEELKLAARGKQRRKYEL